MSYSFNVKLLNVMLLLNNHSCIHRLCLCMMVVSVSTNRLLRGNDQVCAMRIIDGCIYIHIYIYI